MKSRGDSSGRKMTTTPDASRAPRAACAARSGQPSFSLLHADHIAQRVLDVHAHQRRQLAEFRSPLTSAMCTCLVDVILVAAQPETCRTRCRPAHRRCARPNARSSGGSGSGRRWCRSSGRASRAKDSRSGRRAMVPSSFRISTIMAAARKPGQARQIAARLGVPGAGEHPAGLRHQREDVARLAQVLGLAPAVRRRSSPCARGHRPRCRWSRPRPPRSTA